MGAAFPVAPSADAALQAPVGEAEREREAQALAHGPVAFVTEWVGPAFATREAAADAYGARAERPGCALRPVGEAGVRPAAPARPANRDGVRWAPSGSQAQVRWRLSVTYWRIVGEDDDGVLDPARRLRRDPAAGGLDGQALRRLTDQPLRAVRAQQPLDIGLFETRLPERPDVVVPDE